MKKGKIIKFFIALFIVGAFMTFLFLVTILNIFMSANENVCETPSLSTNIEETDDSAAPASIEEFVQQHKDAYILSWKAGGFLPSASIAQTMVENGFNFTNPSGTSLWQAHNMGGVKTSRKQDFPVTIATFGEDAVDITGTKPGTNVGDGTGGAYTWFKSYSAGIVGKAEFMAHQTLYKGAINNTDGIQSLTAIYQGGWATDPTYLVKLHNAYKNLGSKFQWLDQEAIEQHGTTPYESGSGLSIPNMQPSDEPVEVSSSKRAEIVELAKSRLGIPYIWGGTDWEGGMDCSGLTMQVYKRVGIDLPRVSQAQSTVVKKISKEDAQLGDLVFWGGAGSSHHVAIYIGNGKAIEEPQPGGVCKERILHDSDGHWYGTVAGLGSDSGGTADFCKVETTGTSDQVIGSNSAPTLSVPAEYEGKLTLPTPDNNNYAGNNYPHGQCTWGAYNRMAQIGNKIEWLAGNEGNGGSWGAGARRRGYTVITGKPEVGWAASIPGGVAGSDPAYGHIAVVEYVNADGSILVSETNVVNIGSGTRSWRVLSSDTVKQIDFIQGGK